MTCDSHIITSGVGVSLYCAQKFGIVGKSKNMDFRRQHYYQSAGRCRCECAWERGEGNQLVYADAMFGETILNRLSGMGHVPT